MGKANGRSVWSCAIDIEFPEGMNINNELNYNGKVFKAVSKALESVGCNMAGDFMSAEYDQTDTYEANDYFEESLKESASEMTNSDRQKYVTKLNNFIAYLQTKSLPDLDRKDKTHEEVLSTFNDIYEELTALIEIIKRKASKNESLKESVSSDSLLIKYAGDAKKNSKVYRWIGTGTPSLDLKPDDESVSKVSDRLEKDGFNLVDQYDGSYDEDSYLIYTKIDGEDKILAVILMYDGGATLQIDVNPEDEESLEYFEESCSSKKEEDLTSDSTKTFTVEYTSGDSMSREETYSAINAKDAIDQFIKTHTDDDYLIGVYDEYGVEYCPESGEEL